MRVAVPIRAAIVSGSLYANFRSLRTDAKYSLAPLIRLCLINFELD